MAHANCTALRRGAAVVTDYNWADVQHVAAAAAQAAAAAAATAATVAASGGALDGAGGGGSSGVGVDVAMGEAAAQVSPAALPALVPVGRSCYPMRPSILEEVAASYEQRAAAIDPVLREFMFVIPRARAPPPEVWCSRPDADELRAVARRRQAALGAWCTAGGPLRLAFVRQQLFFPDKRLIQYDCGKLQVWWGGRGRVNNTDLCVGFHAC